MERRKINCIERKTQFFGWNIENWAVLYKEENGLFFQIGLLDILLTEFNSNYFLFKPMKIEMEFNKYSTHAQMHSHAHTTHIAFRTTRKNIPISFQSLFNRAFSLYLSPVSIRKNAMLYKHHFRMKIVFFAFISCVFTLALLISLSLPLSFSFVLFSLLFPWNLPPSL